MNKATADRTDKRTFRETQARSQQLKPKKSDLLGDIERVTGAEKKETDDLSNVNIQTA